MNRYSKPQVGVRPIPTIQLRHGVWKRLQGDAHSPPPQCYSQRCFPLCPVLGLPAPLGAEGQHLEQGHGVQPGCEAATPGARGVGPSGSGPVPPPRFSAAQSGRGSGASCDQSGAAGAAAGAGGRGASPESGAGSGAATRRERSETSAAAVEGGSPAPAPAALPRLPFGRYLGPCGRRHR